VTQLDVKSTKTGRELTVQGEVAQGTKVLELFEQSGLVQNTTFKSPLTRGAAPNSDRFHVAGELIAKPLPAVIPDTQLMAQWEAQKSGASEPLPAGSENAATVATPSSPAALPAGSVPTLPAAVAPVPAAALNVTPGASMPPPRVDARSDSKPSDVKADGKAQDSKPNPRLLREALGQGAGVATSMPAPAGNPLTGVAATVPSAVPPTTPPTAPPTASRPVNPTAPVPPASAPTPTNASASTVVPSTPPTGAVQPAAPVRK
jgi:hypothetical protein